jgi:hypothetical protein
MSYKYIQKYIDDASIKLKKVSTKENINSNSYIQESFILMLFTAVIYTAITTISTYLIILNLSLLLSIIAISLQKSIETTQTITDSKTQTENNSPKTYNMLISLFKLITCNTASGLFCYYIFYQLLQIQSFFLGAPTALILTLLILYAFKTSFATKEDLIWAGKYYRDDKLASKKIESAKVLKQALEESSNQALEESSNDVYKKINLLEQEIMNNNNITSSWYYTINSKYKTALLEELFNLRSGDSEDTEEPKWADKLIDFFKTNYILSFITLAVVVLFGYITSPYSFTSSLFFLYPLLNKYIIILTGTFAPWLTLNMLFIFMIVCLYYIYSQLLITSQGQQIDPAPNKTNPLENNPIASIWHGTVSFFRWFYKSGIDSPIVMSIYAFLFFGTIVDLHLPFLPLVWHNFNLTVLFGLVNIHHTAFWLAAMITGFFIGKTFLLINYLINNRSSIFNSEPMSKENKIILSTTFILIICFSLIEAGSPAVLSHIGSWIVFNLVTWNIKPAVILLDLVFNKEKSFIYSIFTSLHAIFSIEKIVKLDIHSVLVLGAAVLSVLYFYGVININSLTLVTLIFLNNPKLFVHIWDLTSQGLVSVAMFPLKNIILPMLHVFIISLIKIISLNTLHEKITHINTEVTKIDIDWSKMNRKIVEYIKKKPDLFLSIAVLTISILSLTNIWTCSILIYLVSSLPFVTIPLNAFCMISAAIATIVLSNSSLEVNYPPLAAQELLHQPDRHHSPKQERGEKATADWQNTPPSTNT